MLNTFRAEAAAAEANTAATKKHLAGALASSRPSLVPQPQHAAQPLRESRLPRAAGI
jgi:hypothetical protein